MRVEQRRGSIVVWAPAKLNLFLEVLGRRDDGFHDLETLMCPIDLTDTLIFWPGADAGPLSLSIGMAGPFQTSAHHRLPIGGGNLVIKALELLRARVQCDRGACVHLLKRVPLEAGLAGGSSDAAAALVAGNLGWRLGLDRSALGELAAELGSDVPFFLHDGPAICRGRGERIEPLAPAALWHAVVVKPAAGLSTAAVYRACRPAAQPRAVAPLVEALRCGRHDRVAALLHNRLQEPAESLQPAVAHLRDEFARANVVAHQMTGSGTAYFGLCRSAQHARQLAARLRARNLGSTSVVRVNC